MKNKEMQRTILVFLLTVILFFGGIYLYKKISTENNYAKHIEFVTESNNKHTSSSIYPKYTVKTLEEFGEIYVSDRDVFLYFIFCIVLNIIFFPSGSFKRRIMKKFEIKRTIMIFLLTLLVVFGGKYVYEEAYKYIKYSDYVNTCETEELHWMIEGDRCKSVGSPDHFYPRDPYRQLYTMLWIAIFVFNILLLRRFSLKKKAIASLIFIVLVGGNLYAYREYQWEQKKKRIDKLPVLEGFDLRPRLEF